jgi:hypothetical protein
MKRAHIVQAITRVSFHQSNRPAFGFTTRLGVGLQLVQRELYAQRVKKPNQ